MGKDEDRPVIELYIDMEYDARTHRKFCYAPDDWDTMTDKERAKFLQEEAELYRDEQIECGGIFHASGAAAAKATGRAWGDNYSPEIVEERW